MSTLYCACCGRPFKRTSNRGPAPLYCSHDCRLQIATRRRAWGREDASAAAWGMGRALPRGSGNGAMARSA